MHSKGVPDVGYFLQWSQTGTKSDRLNGLIMTLTPTVRSAPHDNSHFRTASVKNVFKKEKGREWGMKSSKEKTLKMLFSK